MFLCSFCDPQSNSIGITWELFKFWVLNSELLNQKLCVRRGEVKQDLQVILIICQNLLSSGLALLMTQSR